MALPNRLLKLLLQGQLNVRYLITMEQLQNIKEYDQSWKSFLFIFTLDPE